MHANALITFDLDKLRAAGLMLADQQFVFRADRAGLNDDTFGNGGTSTHLAVIVSRPHRKADVYDGIIAGYVNGEPVKTAENDRVYYFAGQIPAPLKSDGRFAKFEVLIPSDAKYLTLVSTGAGGPGENTISSDHSVFSGARLELNPLPIQTIAAIGQAAEAARSEADQQQARLDAQTAVRNVLRSGIALLARK